MRIYHNIPALIAYNALNTTNKALSKSIEKLSTGLRINSAADDAAGLAISERMRAQISGMEVAIRNAEDGVSMLQTAEGALSATHSILQRMRELAVQAANDTLTSQDRGYVQLEIDELKAEIDRIATSTQFNGKKLLDGTSAGIWSTNNLSTKVYIRGSLREVDQFNQKSAFEGNYKIVVNASGLGQAEAQKTDIFKIKHPNVVMNVGLVNSAGAQALRVDNLPAGDYRVTTADSSGVAAGAKPSGAYGFDKYWETTLTPGSNGSPLTSNGTGMIKISLANGGSVEVAVTIDSSGNVDKTKIVDAIKAAKLDGLAVSDSSGVITFTSVKGAVTVEQTGLDSNAVPALIPPDAAGQEKKIDFLSLMQANADSSGTYLKNNASILFEVTSVNTTAGTVTLKATANVLGTDGSVNTYVNDNVVLSEGDWVDLSETLGLGTTDVTSTNPGDGTNGAFQIQLNKNEAMKFTVGNKFVYNVTAKATANAVQVEIAGTQNQDWTYKWGESVVDDQDPITTDDRLRFGLDAEKVKNKELHFRNFYLNDKNGTVYEGDIVITTTNTQMAHGTTLATFEAAYIGQVAKADVKLRDLDKFWNTSGVFMLNDPQTITISQGDGVSTSITLYATDTLEELRRKLNDAIANGLGQAKFAVSNANDFVTFVESGSEKNYGLETVPGTFIIRSLIAGAAGELSFSGNEDLINALSLNVVQSSRENSFTASVYDAHTGATIATNVKVSGNQLIGIIHPNVDVEFDAMAGIKVEWNDNLRNFVLTADNKPYETIVHLVDNSTIFQVGANEGEDLALDIGNMSVAALGVNRIIVTDRESAARSITILDTAIGKVSAQRAKIGAYQNRLEYTVENLTTTSTNLSAAESRIRDADMAHEMMEFVKLQILNQSGTAMLAQANQLPQSVLSLLG